MTSEITLNQFRASYPEFPAPDFSDSLISESITIASQISAVSTTASMLLVAHILTLGKSSTVDGGAGIIKSETLGEKSVTYKNQAENNAEVWFCQTQYGRLFLTIQNRSPKKVMSMKVL